MSMPLFSIIRQTHPITNAVLLAILRNTMFIPPLCASPCVVLPGRAGQPSVALPPTIAMEHQGTLERSVVREASDVACIAPFCLVENSSAVSSFLERRACRPLRKE